MFTLRDALRRKRRQILIFPRDCARCRATSRGSTSRSVQRERTLTATVHGPAFSGPAFSDFLMIIIYYFAVCLKTTRPIGWLLYCKQTNRKASQFRPWVARTIVVTPFINVFTVTAFCFCTTNISITKTMHSFVRYIILCVGYVTFVRQQTATRPFPRTHECLLHYTAWNWRELVIKFARVEACQPRVVAS